MTRRLSIILLMVTGFLLWTAASAWAAPSLGSINGYMSNSEWSGAQTVEYGNSDGTYYDVEKLGLYIDDNMLYIGIQTDYHLDGGYTTNDWKYKYDEYGVKQPYGNWYIDPGDFAFDFNGDGSYEAGIDFNLSNGNFSFTFFEIDPNDWQNPKTYLKDSPYTAYVQDYKTSQTSGTGANDFEAKIAYFDDNDLSPGDVLEAAINLDTLSAELNQLFQNSTTVNLFWTMECGNDSLMVTENYSYTPDTGSQVPEPTTMVLLGMGLLGIGAVNRKRRM